MIFARNPSATFHIVSQLRKVLERQRRVYPNFFRKIGKLGPVHTAGGPLIESGCREILGLSASMRGKKFLRWQFAEVCEAANTDLSSVFQICSSNAFGLASQPVSLKPSRPRPLPGARNESRAFAESLPGVECVLGKKLGARSVSELSHALPTR